MNTALQGALNPARPGEPAAERFGWRFQVRDKVIQTENDYKKEVFNGDIGTIEKGKFADIIAVSGNPMADFMLGVPRSVVTIASNETACSVNCAGSPAITGTRSPSSSTTTSITRTRSSCVR